MFIDSHCHFDFDCFNEPQALWQQCLDANIKQLIVPGIEVNQWQKSIDIANRFDGIHYSLGIHPWFLSKQTDDWPKRLAESIEQHQPIAIGECGLDKHIDLSITRQQQALSMHIELANQHQLPLILHSVGTHDLLYQQLKKTPCHKGGVIHGFSGSLVQAERFIELGFYLGVGGNITYERAKKTRNIFAVIDSQFLLLETDAPDMPPAGCKKGENTPLNLSQIAQALAKLKNCSVEDIANITTNNCKKLFSLTSAT